MTDKPNLMKLACALAECDEWTQAAFMRFIASMIPDDDAIETIKSSQDFGNKKGDAD